MILGLAIKAKKYVQYCLAASCREGGKMSRGIANQGDVKGGRVIGVGMVNTFGDTSVLPLNIQCASRSGKATGKA